MRLAGVIEAVAISLSAGRSDTKQLIYSYFLNEKHSVREVSKIILECKEVFRYEEDKISNHLNLKI